MYEYKWYAYFLSYTTISLALVHMPSRNVENSLHHIHLFKFKSDS